MAAATSERFMFLLPRVKAGILRRLIAGDALARLAHVVAAQLAQRIADERGGDILAPVKIEVGVVHGFRARGGETPGFPDHFIAEGLVAQEVVRAIDQKWPRRHRAEREARAALD